MAALSSFGITVLLNASVTNPTNAATFQVVTPWGKSSACARFEDAMTQVCMGKGGTSDSGRMGAYFDNQTLYGATGSGPTGYLNATEVGG